jgi:3-deoxy-D-manno-octulosonic-acid transferase
MKHSETPVEIVARLLSRLAGAAAVPLVLLRAIVDKRWRRGLSERRGLGGWMEESWQQRAVVWFHGASVGEIAGLAPVLEQVRKAYPAAHILITTTSLTGRDEARRRRLGDSVLLFPLDHAGYVRRVLLAVQPRVVVISETELWPNFLFAARSFAIPVIMINGRISEYSFPRYVRFRALFRPLLRSMKQILVQTATDAERFLQIGADPERLIVSGSTKYSRSPDIYSADELRSFRELLGLRKDRPCFVAGSVRSGEDEIVLRAFLKAREVQPGLQMIIAPRHPERFQKVARLMCDHNIDFHLRSAGKPSSPVSVVLLDTLGELTKAYALGSFAFVGGSLVDIGGHNPFEPAAFHLPVIFGPFCANVEDAVEELHSGGGLLTVNDESELADAISRLALNADECFLRGAQAFTVWKRNSLAVDRVLPVLAPYIEAAEKNAHTVPLQAAV